MDQKVKIMDLGSATPVDTDWIPFIDISDTTQSPEGSTKRALKSDLKGDTGDNATVTAGTTTTGDAGTYASVINVGTTGDAIFDFTIPRGDVGTTGATGPQGIQGIQGDDGNGIASISLVSTVGLVKTYRITYTDTTTFDYVVTDGVGTGDVIGPASVVSNNVVFFDGTTGKIIKDSGLTLSGSNTGDNSPNTNSGLVHTTGDETIAGVKTFSDSTNQITTNRAITHTYRSKNNADNGGVKFVVYNDADNSVVGNRKWSLWGYPLKTADGTEGGFESFISCEFPTYDGNTTYTKLITLNAPVTITGTVGASNLSGTNTGNQTIANTSDGTSHTATLSATGGSIKLVEGANITLTTTGTSADGIVTIASTGGAGLTNFTEGVNTSAPNATVPVVSMTATNAATNVDMALVPKGTGAFTLAVADNLATGGNKRGINAIDLQIDLGNATRVASGNYSIAIGSGNTASSTASTAIGRINIASGDYSLAIGNSYNTAQSYGETVIGPFATVGAGTAGSYVSTDRLFVVGNGTSSGARSNAMTILKNGNTAIAGTFSPQQATTAGAPSYVKGSIYFDTTLNKLRVGGATAWETITSV